MSDYVHEVLGLKKNINLRYEDFEGKKVELSGNLHDQMHIKVVKEDKQIAVVKKEPKVEPSVYQ